GAAKMRGWAQYTADVELPGMVYAKVLRSTYPHAKLVRVDASRAEKLTGVVAVLTRDDLKGMNAYFGPVVKDQPVVAIDRVRYVGEVIAAVGAGGGGKRGGGVDLICVGYERRPGGVGCGVGGENETPRPFNGKEGEEIFPSEKRFPARGYW